MVRTFYTESEYVIGEKKTYNLLKSKDNYHVLISLNTSLLYFIQGCPAYPSSRTHQKVFRPFEDFLFPSIHLSINLQLDFI